MAATAVVELPRSATPQFPRRCILCGRSNPDATLKVRGHLLRWWTVVPMLLVSLLSLWKPHSTDVPACAECKTRFRRQQIVRPIVAMLVGVPVLSAVGMFMGPTVLTVLGVLLVCFLPRRAIAVPPPVELAVFAKSVEFEFKDAAYAQEFARVNASSAESV
jgi:hypothetical protein